MNIPAPVSPARSGMRSAWMGLLAWVIGGSALFALDGRLDLANLAMLYVLTSAVASLWLPPVPALAIGVLGVAAFNWSFVPPRHTFAVELEQHALLLAALLVVNGIVSALMLAQRRAAERAGQAAGREAALRAWGDLLRDAPEPTAHFGALQAALTQATGVPAALWSAETLQAGQADADERAGLALCAREGHAFGCGSGRHEEQPDVYLPLRGRGAVLGAALLQGLGPLRPPATLLAHAQALCDQMGLALQRHAGSRTEQAAREEAREQGVRNALLSAIAHDYRTPLASIMGAASSLHDQAERLDVAQRRRLAAGIVDETERLARLTDNTLQLARLGAPGVALRCDWESAEEIVGAVLARVRRRDTGNRVHARLEPGLPLLWCDAMLMSQLLENLVDNALKYSPEDAPVEVLARRVAEGVMLAVSDRGAGVKPAWRERIFHVFQRGEPDARGTHRPGTGVGLAVCRAIAQAHGGSLKLRGRTRGGSSFECVLPVREPPALPVAET
jgi:two-component system sensor histidine kinase KdpD